MEEWVELARVLGREDAEAGNPLKNDRELHDFLVSSISDYAHRQTFMYWWTLSDGQAFAEAYDAGFSRA